jgi:glycosyltransferase involved in cell wall biosynthesis
MVAAITGLAADAGLRARIGRAGRARVAANYEWDVLVDQLLEIYAAASAGSS